MNIKILGGGCANCKRLEQITRKVVDDNKMRLIRPCDRVCYIINTV